MPELGVQVNFAPVADVNINPKNPVINTRSFGENPVNVANKVIAYARVWKTAEYSRYPNIFRGMGIRTWIRINRFRFYRSRASVWTVSSCILLEKLFRQG